MPESSSLPPGILGVIDLKEGRAVHAIAGQRSAYQPVSCRYTKQGDAVALAQGYLAAGCQGLYLADLDAIEGIGSNQKLLEQLSTLTEEVWIDAGAHLWRTIEFESIRIVATESFENLASLASELEARASHPIALSLDLIGGKVRFLAGSDEKIPPAQVAELAYQHGVGNLIVLEISAVGVGKGPQTEPICRQIQASYPQLRLVSGGGIRTICEMKTLKKAGCQRFLIGTALHNGPETFMIGSGSC